VLARSCFAEKDLAVLVDKFKMNQQSTLEAKKANSFPLSYTERCQEVRGGDPFLLSAGEPWSAASSTVLPRYSSSMDIQLQQRAMKMIKGL